MSQASEYHTPNTIKALKQSLYLAGTESSKIKQIVPNSKKI
jgi:hypothetical protein